MVPDLEHVDRPQQAALQQQLLDRCLRVAGEQRTEAAALQQQDHRAVVDVAFGQGRLRIRRIGKEHEKARPFAERNQIAGPGQMELSSGLGARQSDEAWVGGVLVLASRLIDDPDAEPLECRNETGDVVLVRVGEDHHVQPALPEGKPGSELTERQVRIRAAVDECGLA